MAKYPSDIYGHMLPIALGEVYPEFYKTGLMYLDLWPITTPMLVVFNPEIMAQFTQENSMPKAEHLHEEFMPWTGAIDIVNLDGPEWKKWRAVYNPAFSAKNITSLIPTMLEDVGVFAKWLRGIAASGKSTQLERQTTKLMVDLMGRAVL